MGTCIESKGKASVPSHNDYRDISGTFTTEKGLVAAFCTQGFGMLFPTGVSCVYEVVWKLKSEALAFPRAPRR